MYLIAVSSNRLLSCPTRQHEDTSFSCQGYLWEESIPDREVLFAILKWKELAMSTAAGTDTVVPGL